MAKSKGSLDYGFNFNIGASGPIDSRMLVDFKSDLTNTTTWPADSSPVYDGMQVVVKEDNNIYILTDKSNYTNLSSWKQIGSSTSVGDGSTVKMSNKYINVVYPNLSGFSETFQAVVDNESIDASVNKLEDNIVSLINVINKLKLSVLGTDNVQTPTTGNTVLDRLESVEEQINSGGIVGGGSLDGGTYDGETTYYEFYKKLASTSSDGYRAALVSGEHVLDYNYSANTYIYFVEALRKFVFATTENINIYGDNGESNIVFYTDVDKLSFRDMNHGKLLLPYIYSGNSSNIYYSTNDKKYYKWNHDGSAIEETTI